MAADVALGRPAAEAVTAAADAAAPGVGLAVAVLDRRTGELALGWRGDEPLHTASLAEIVVAIDGLDRRRSEGLAVTAEAVDYR